MSPVTEALSPIASVSEVVREEIIALLVDLQGPSPTVSDVRLSMDVVEIAQERLEEADDDELIRISPAVPV
jgi:hypothetical protein